MIMKQKKNNKNKDEMQIYNSDRVSPQTVMGLFIILAILILVGSDGSILGFFQKLSNNSEEELLEEYFGEYELVDSDKICLNTFMGFCVKYNKLYKIRYKTSNNLDREFEYYTNSDIEKSYLRESINILQSQINDMLNKIIIDNNYTYGNVFNIYSSIIPYDKDGNNMISNNEKFDIIYPKDVNIRNFNNKNYLIKINFRIETVCSSEECGSVCPNDYQLEIVNKIIYNLKQMTNNKLNILFTSDNLDGVCGFDNIYYFQDEITSEIDDFYIKIGNL